MVLLSAMGAAVLESKVEYDYYKYHPMHEITNWMAQLLKEHPDVVSIVDYGQTYEKRTISLLKIGINTGEKKKAVWMDCGIHAREWIAPAFCQYFVAQILQTYKTDPKMELMMKNLDFYVTPVLNMDGYIYSWENSSTRLWRKNRSPGPSGCDCYGTDLNRNFDANWGTIGVSFNCTRKDDFLCFLTIHSYGQLVLVPYGNPNFTASNYDELMKVGLAAAHEIWKVHGKNYTVGSSPDVLYPNSGSSRDWARLQGIPYSYTFELRDNGTFGFQLPENQIQPTCEEAYRGTFNSAVATAVNLWTILFAAGVSTLIIWM
ncbi:hypothetical protein Q5P01_005532 [Channa striata]|uniref:Peptidase M14 domain-containing protein n=1 Tax=Channa striata TaxID=64152 RepID=A0AA88T7F5_CHASR|nr:hypothetical protein Q5P01_005532 [Channa striata]